MLAFAESDVVDLQFAICDRNASELAEKLGFKKQPQQRSITYYDHPDASLAKRGVFPKLKNEGGTFTSEIKVLYSPFQSLPDNSECEIDRYGNNRQEKCSLEFEAERKPKWTPQQKDLAEAGGKIDWRKLTAFGPYLESKWKRKIDNDLQLSLEILTVPGARPISEISVKTTQEEEEDVFLTIMELLEEKNIHLCPRQEGKIFRVLKL